MRADVGLRYDVLELIIQMSGADRIMIPPFNRPVQPLNDRLPLRSVHPGIAQEVYWAKVSFSSILYNRLSGVILLRDCRIYGLYTIIPEREG